MNLERNENEIMADCIVNIVWYPLNNVLFFALFSIKLKWQVLFLIRIFIAFAICSFFCVSTNSRITHNVRFLTTSSFYAWQQQRSGKKQIFYITNFGNAWYIPTLSPFSCKKFFAKFPLIWKFILSFQVHVSSNVTKVTYDGNISEKCTQ